MFSNKRNRLLRWTLINFLLSTVLIHPLSMARANIDFTGIDAVSSPDNTDKQFMDRAQRARARVIERAPSIIDGGELFQHEENGIAAVLAYLEQARQSLPLRDFNVEKISQFLMRSQVRSRSGTGSDDIPGCHRTGEWDVALKGLVVILYRYGDLLQPQVYDHVLGLLNQTGPHNLDVEQWDCMGISIPESENHLLNIETSRFLTNQLLKKSPRGAGHVEFDNQTNGMKEYILKKLQQFLRNDFKEYNARPYQRYSISSIQNLYDYSEDPEVKTAAQMVLDYVAAKFAVSSNRLRRAAPFRRLAERAGVTALFVNESDPLTWRFFIHSGNIQLVPNPLTYDGAADDMQYWSLTDYRVPYLIQDLIVNQDHKDYYQRLHHDGVEIYSSSGSYLISAGGIWMESGYGYDEYTGYKQVAIPLPITLMPTREGADRNEFIRIDGFPDPEGREKHNTCVARNFACGWFPIIPDIPERYSKQEIVKGETWAWKFVDASQNEGFYVAVYTRPYLAEWEYWCKKPARDSGHDCRYYSLPYGFFEVAESAGLSFNEFRERVLAKNNKLFSQHSTGTYETISGDRIEFAVPHQVPSNKYQWAISKINDVPVDSDIGHWPLAEGDIIKSPGTSGYIEIRNPHLNQTLTLDFTDLNHPKRTLPITHLLLCRDLSAGCGTIESASHLLLLH